MKREMSAANLLPADVFEVFSERIEPVMTGGTNVKRMDNRIVCRH